MHEVPVLFIGVILTNKRNILLLYSFLPREECTTTCYHMISTDIFAVDLIINGKHIELYLKVLSLQNLLNSLHFLE